MKHIAHTCLAALLIAVVAAPLAAQQQNKKKKQPTLAERTAKRYAKAELSEEQVAKIKVLAEKHGPAMQAAQKKAVLSAEQRTAMNAARKKAQTDGLKGKELRAAVQSAANLSDEQKEALAEQRKLSQEYSKAVLAVLTAEQRKKVGQGSGKKPANKK